MCRLCKGYKYAGNSPERYSWSEQTKRYEEPERIPSKKKNTKVNCKGVQGRAHEPEVREVRSEWRLKSGKGLCYWVEWLSTDPKREPYRRYSCGHQVVCANCQKILKDSLDKECPNRDN